MFTSAKVGTEMGAAISNPKLSRVEVVATIGGVRVRRRRGERAFFFVAGMAIDADGAPRAYHRNGSPPGLDFLANAGHPGNWWGIVTNRHGEPVVQSTSDPAPGFYVSTTALQDPARRERDPRRYVDSSTIAYVVVPALLLARAGVRLGDFAVVRNRRNGKIAHAIVADTGPAGKIGEGSIALARTLGIPPSPKHGGQDGNVVYVVFPGSGNRRPRPQKDIEEHAGRLLERWGGHARLERL
jgi:Fungal chitosanase of glycosyl hydrolase group 75